MIMRIFIFIVLVSLLSSCQSKSKDINLKAKQYNDSATTLLKKDIILKGEVDTNTLKNILPLFDLAIQADSSFQIAYNNKYKVLLQLKKLREAIDVYLICAYKGFNKDNLKVTLGILYEKIGMKDSAFICYRQSLDFINKHNLTDCESMYYKLISLKMLNEPSDPEELLNEECKKALEYFDIYSTREKIIEEFNDIQKF